MKLLRGPLQAHELGICNEGPGQGQRLALRSGQLLTPITFPDVCLRLDLFQNLRAEMEAFADVQDPLHRSVFRMPGAIHQVGVEAAMKKQDHVWNIEYLQVSRNEEEGRSIVQLGQVSPSKNPQQRRLPGMACADNGQKLSLRKFQPSIEGHGLIARIRKLQVVDGQVQPVHHKSWIFFSVFVRLLLDELRSRQSTVALQISAMQEICR
mmetsp:Transcript_33882/g.78807  ORF Transcript_33882/g.78807 Transcript_33882/m.78807 type:complete len:209 (-) Transcript_33882:1900-2526(-)